jgi:O-antigen/teichoic acid export membrane protein
MGGTAGAFMIGVSAPLAMVVAGLLIGHKIHVNQDKNPVQKAINSFWEILDDVFNGILFVLIITNLNELFLVLPEEYRGGFIIVFLIGLAKVYDSLLGNNNAILYNSDYYRTLLAMGVLLAVLVVLLNIWLIPILGLNGAALATFIAIVIYNTIKLVYVKLKFGIMPFTSETVKVFGLLLVLGSVFFFVTLPFHTIVNILLKSVLTVILYLGILYRFKISEDVYRMLSKFVKK